MSREPDQEPGGGRDGLDPAREGAGRGGGEGDPALIWLREEPRGRRASHTRAEIARAAVEIADGEGFDAVSMRRVARRLGAGTMTLYHYVRNKDELITLMADEVMGELLIPDDELADGWREALVQLANRSRNVFLVHRWTLDHFGDVSPGPNGLRHFEQSLHVVGSLDIPEWLAFELIVQVDDYVFGFVLREQQEREERERGFPPEALEFFQRELDSGEYPLLTRYLGEDVNAGVDRIAELIADEDRFDRGLKRLLDGFEAELGSRGKSRSRSKGRSSGEGRSRSKEPKGSK